MHIAADPSGVTLTIVERSRWVRCFVLFFSLAQLFLLLFSPFSCFLAVPVRPRSNVLSSMHPPPPLSACWYQCAEPHLRSDELQMRLQKIHSLLRVSGTPAWLPVCQIFHSSCPVEVHAEDKSPPVFWMRGSYPASHFLGELSSDWINLGVACFDFGLFVHANLPLLQLWSNNLICSACYRGDISTYGYRHCTELEYLLRAIKVKCIACKQYFPFSRLGSRQVGDCPFKCELQNIAPGSSAPKKLCGNTCLPHLLPSSCIHMVVWMVLDGCAGIAPAF